MHIAYGAAQICQNAVVKVFVFVSCEFFYHGAGEFVVFVVAYNQFSAVLICLNQDVGHGQGFVRVGKRSEGLAYDVFYLFQSMLACFHHLSDFALCAKVRIFFILVYGQHIKDVTHPVSS